MTTPLLHSVLPAASRSARQGDRDGCRRRGRRRRLASEGKAETAGGGQGRRLGIYEWGIDAEREGGGLFVKYTECEGAFVKLKAQAKIQRGMPNVASTVVFYEFVTADKLEG